MIEVKNLSKSYGEFEAIKDLSFDIQKGRVVGLLGTNGAGKSTTMKIMTGFMAPTKGCVKIDGIDIFDDPISVKRKLGYLPEVPPLYSDMIVEDYLKFVAGIKGVVKSDVQEYVEDAILKTALIDVRSRRIEALSKGYKQRVGIAQALVAKPEVLILDEPTVGLDPKQVHEVRALILELKKHHTIILSTHILSEVQATCDDVVILQKGQIVTQSNIQDLTNLKSGGAKLKVTVISVNNNLIEKLPHIDGVNSVSVMDKQIEIGITPTNLVIADVSRVIVESKAGLLELKLEQQNLEDIFIHLTEDHAPKTGGLP